MDSVQLANRFRSILLEIGEQINCLDHRISVEELLQVSQKVSASAIFSTGGSLFDFWVVQHANTTISKILKQEMPQISENSEKEIVRSCGIKFYSYVIKAVRDVKPSLYRQLYYITLLLYWKGCTGAGLQLISNTNIALSKYLFEKIKKEQCQEEMSDTLQIVNGSQPYVLWIDNYTKFFSKGFVSLKRDTASLVSLTAVGLSVVANQMADNLKILTYGSPNSQEMLEEDVFTFVRGKMTALWSVWPSHYSASKSCCIHVTTVPPSDKTSLDQLVEDIERLESVNGLQDFRGVDILPQDIGSNKGLAQVLDWIFVQTNGGQYSLCKADQNIYWRYMKVLGIQQT